MLLPEQQRCWFNNPGLCSKPRKQGKIAVCCLKDVGQYSQPQAFYANACKIYLVKYKRSCNCCLPLKHRGPDPRACKVAASLPIIQLLKWTYTVAPFTGRFAGLAAQLMVHYLLVSPVRGRVLRDLKLLQAASMHSIKSEANNHQLCVQEHKCECKKQ